MLSKTVIVSHVSSSVDGNVSLTVSFRMCQFTTLVDYSNVSIIIGLIVMKCGSNIHVSHGMNQNNFKDRQT